MNTPMTILLNAAGTPPPPEGLLPTWAANVLLGVTIVFIVLLAFIFRKSFQALYALNRAPLRPRPHSGQARRTNIGDLPPTPPTGESHATPRAMPSQSPQRADSGYRVVEEFSGDSALRGDFADILGAMGKKLDQVAKATEESRVIIQDLKKENGRLVEENSRLLDLLQNDKHRQLLRNLVKAANFCELSIRGLKDNPKAVEALSFVRDECRDRLADAGLTPYEPALGTPLGKLEGALFEAHPRTIPTDLPERNNTVAEVHSIGYFYERDDKKLSVAKAEVVFYRHSPAPNSNPTEQAPR